MFWENDAILSLICIDWRHFCSEKNDNDLMYTSLVFIHAEEVQLFSELALDL